MRKFAGGLMLIALLAGCSPETLAQVALNTAVQAVTQAAVQGAIDTVKQGASPAPAIPGLPTVTTGDQAPTGDFAAEIQAAHTQANKERAAQGLPALVLQSNISEVARQYSVYMATNDHFAHEDLQGNGPDQRLTAAGIGWHAMGENILYNYEGTGLAAIQQWMNSPGHKANILSTSFGHVGYGVYKDASGKFWWTQDFTD